MENCHVVPSLFFFYLIIFVVPYVFSTVQLSNRRHPRFNNVSDQEALLGFMSAITTYDPFQPKVFTDWKPNVSFCEWTGIICSRRRQRVVSLNLSSMALQGTITPLLGNLSFLRILDLSNNSFHSHIPYQLGSLFRLRMLLLYRNQLQGSIPPTLCGCRSLRNLTVFDNHLVGNIPSELCVLPKLKFFDLAMNNLTGGIPACLGNISSLDLINFYSNHLQGSVPSELGMLNDVTTIILENNNLGGQVPPSLSNCTNLLQLDLSFNRLTGHIPGELCTKNTQLKLLYMSDNQLIGKIPASIFNCTKLQRISLGYNQLSGEVPMELGMLTQLQVLYLNKNKLSSGGSTNSLPIVTALTNCSALQLIELAANHFTGRLPISIGRLSANVDFIHLSRNELGGEIPEQIGNLTSLTYLALDLNHFTGTIPSSLTMLQKLERLYMGGNNLNGNIPIQIGRLKRLGLLELEQNNFSGRIPDSIADLPQLRYLYLSQNQLSYNIPASLGKCFNLLDLDLSYNKFSGRIPPEVADLANLAFTFNLSHNLLHGPVPLGLGKMIMLQAIDISANQLTGYIPSGIGSCKELELLNLSNNALEGLIPTSLGELQNLEYLDFSSNNLSGGIPLSLENLKMLLQLNLSFNQLSGEVPKGGVFKKLGATTFVGNTGLCGPWVNLPPCKHKSVSHLKRVIIPVAAVTTTIVLCFVLGILWRLNCKRHISREVPVLLNVGHRRISYGEIIAATNEFSDANLLGVGSFGKVYKGVLNDDTIVAIKLLNLDNEGAHKSFVKECNVLGRVRHRNLIGIITTYSDLQIKALIFPFMPNGSLDKWLYPNGEEESGLTLLQRLNIAIDIAQGLTYLHHHSFVQVIHCDLKPSNVLLGEDMTACLTDFGIATMYFTNSEDSNYTSTHALKGSPGYIPPKYALGGHVTTKGDVYSYGIVLLEMLTRKNPTHNMFVEGMNLNKWVSNNFPNRVAEVVDKTLLRRTDVSIEEDKELNLLTQLVSVGLFCTNESPERRPTMMDVVRKLLTFKDTFLSIVGDPNFQSISITNLLGNTCTAGNDVAENESSSTF